MRFIPSTEMKITLAPDQAEMLSSAETIREIIRENPDRVMAFDIFDGGQLIGFVLVDRFEERKYFLWEYAIDTRFQNRHRGTQALAEFIDLLALRYGAAEITTTYLFGNEHAKHVYEKVGFVETDMVDEPDCHEVNMAYAVGEGQRDETRGQTAGSARVIVSRETCRCDGFWARKSAASIQPLAAVCDGEIVHQICAAYLACCSEGMPMADMACSLLKPRFFIRLLRFSRRSFSMPRVSPRFSPMAMPRLSPIIMPLASMPLLRLHILFITSVISAVMGMWHFSSMASLRACTGLVSSNSVFRKPISSLSSLDAPRWITIRRIRS
ncbi:MAG: GNAT family N-acetyltransferase [Clostridia bacterium]|nr:GNAT family N-acetyltransferase [Clostridia bacterium]